MPSATSSTKPRMSSHHSSHSPLPTVTPTSPATDRHAQSRPAADAAFLTFTNPPTPPTTPPREVPLFEQPSTHDSNATSPPSCSPLHSRLLYVAHCDGSSSLSARWGGRPAICVVLLYILAASPPLSGARRKLASAKIALACAPCTAQETSLRC
jgi:hypothetical protein